MLAKEETVPRGGLKSSSCAACGRSVRINPLKCSDTDIVGKSCRCKRCSIPISARPCDRCGIAHGTPSSEPGLCERCHVVEIDHPAGAGLHEGALPFPLMANVRAMNGGSLR